MLLWAIADDLTSATEVVAPFASRGFEAGVAFPSSGRALVRDVAALAISTESRGVTVEAAVKRTLEAATRYNGAPLLFKTVDSTLRGHIAAELEALRRFDHRRCTIVAPAFPGAGRVTRDGVQLVDNRPVAASEFARDPVSPVTESSLRNLLARAGQPIAYLPAPAANHLSLLLHHVAAGALIIADAESDAHLDQLVAAVPAREALWLGSPGLARALARGHRRTGIAQYRPAAGSGRLLVVVASLHPVRKPQLLDLAREGALVLEMSAESNIESASDRLMEGASKAFSDGWETVVISSPSVKRTIPRPALYSAALAEIAAMLIRECLVAGVVVTGGDTAAHFTAALATPFLSVQGEIEPGVPIGSVGLKGDLPIVTKAGGFGDPGILSRACEALRSTPALMSGGSP